MLTHEQPPKHSSLGGARTLNDLLHPLYHIALQRETGGREWHSGAQRASVRACRGFSGYAQPHDYLAVLGAKPALQGRGLGAAVLSAGLSRCDREQLPAYLETAAPQTIPFYERHGFRTCGEVTIPHGGPLVRWMWRTPQMRGADSQGG